MNRLLKYSASAVLFLNLLLSIEARRKGAAGYKKHRPLIHTDETLFKHRGISFVPEVHVDIGLRMLKFEDEEAEEEVENGKEEEGKEEEGKEEEGKEEEGKEEEGKEEDNPVCEGEACNDGDEYDITLVVETSTFNGTDNWLSTTKPFVRAVANKFKIAKNTVRMSLLFFDSKPEEFISFTDPASQNKKEFLDKVDSISADDIGKYHNVLYCDALLYSIENMLYEDGTRPYAYKASVLITYGYDNETNRPIIPEVVRAFKTEGATLITVGMEMGGNENIYLLADCVNNDTNCPNAIIVQHEYLFSAAREIKVKLEKSVQGRKA